MRPFVMSRFTAIAFVTGLCFSAPAVADLMPAPIPECVGKPDGTFCKLADGTAGQCKTNPDARRPGKSWQSCTKDPHECDHLAVGAECHGYLGRPAHCKEFSDPDKGTRWRTCQVDETTSAAAPATNATNAAAPAAEPPPAKKGMFSCSAAPAATSASSALTMLLSGLPLLLFAARRRARRKPKLG